MNLSTAILGLSSITTSKKQKQIFNYINKHPEEQAKKALKEYKNLKWITLLIILLVIIPLITYVAFSIINTNNNANYSNNATKKINGHISLYKDTFWYTDSNQKYEFDFGDYNIDKSYKPGENIIIYLDNNNNVISIAHQTKDYEIIIKVILILIIPIILLLINSFIAKKTYAKNWYLYLEWYNKEIDPYRYQHNFEEIIANKQYYNVIINFKDLSEEKQKLYKKYKSKKIIYIILFMCCISLTLYFGIKFNLNPNSLLIVSIITLYTVPFCILNDNCNTKMKKIKNGYLDNN